MNKLVLCFPQKIETLFAVRLACVNVVLKSNDRDERYNITRLTRDIFHYFHLIFRLYNVSRTDSRDATLTHVT